MGAAIAEELAGAWLWGGHPVVVGQGRGFGREASAASASPAPTWCRTTWRGVVDVVRRALRDASTPWSTAPGTRPKGELLELTDDDWHLGLDMMLLNVVRACRLVTPVMEKQGSGAILNISTYATFEPEPFFPLSGAYRAGLAAFAKIYADTYAAARHPHQQPASGVHRQPAREGAVPRPHPHGALWNDPRGGTDGGLPACPTTPATSPDRTCASTAASRAPSERPQAPTGLQQRLLQHAMDALVAVDDLRHPQIGGEAAEAIGILSATGWRWR